MKNETLWWTIGGVAIALIALFAMTRNSGGGASSGGSSGGGGISANALVSEVNTVNTNAARVEQDRIAALHSYAIHSSDNQLGIFQSAAHTAEDELATLTNAATTRYVSDNQTQMGEYAANQNAITAQFAAEQSTLQNQANDQVAAQQIAAQENIAHFSSDNAVTMARIQHGSSFGNFMQSLVGAASNFFGSATGAKVLGVG